MKRYLRHMLQLVLSPAHGWEDIEASADAPGRIAAEGFYPIVGLTALSVFAGAMWHHHFTFISLLLEALATALSFFAGYFILVFVLAIFLEPMLRKDARYDERRTQTFALYTTGLLAAISLLVNCLPFSFIMLFFLPLYVALIQWKGTDYMQIAPTHTGAFMIVAILGGIVPPYILLFLFSQLIEK